MNITTILIAGLLLLVLGIALSAANFLLTLIGPLIVPALCLLGIWFVIRFWQGTESDQLTRDVRGAGEKILRTAKSATVKAARVGRAAFTAASEEIKK